MGPLGHFWGPTNLNEVHLWGYKGLQTTCNMITCWIILICWWSGISDKIWLSARIVWLSPTWGLLMYWLRHFYPFWTKRFVWFMPSRHGGNKHLWQWNVFALVKKAHTLVLDKLFQTCLVTWNFKSDRTTNNQPTLPLSRDQPTHLQLTYRHPPKMASWRTSFVGPSIVYTCQSCLCKSPSPSP